MQDSSLLLLAIHQDSERTVEAYMAHILRLFYGWHRIQYLLVHEASLLGIRIYREIAHAERGEVLEEVGALTRIDVNSSMPPLR